MAPFTSAEVVVQRQLEAYKARHLDAWLATDAEDARQFELGGALLAQGHAAIRAHMESRFREPNLHAALLRRVVMGHVVIDHEEVSRTFPEGAGKVEMVCVYVVERGRIQTASFHIGPAVLDPAAP